MAWEALEPLTINAGRRQGRSFDQFVAALGTPTDPNALPDPIEIDPAHVAGVCAAHGIDVLGPPPPPIAQKRDLHRGRLDEQG